MAIKKFNSVDGFSVGSIATDVIDSAANVSANNLTVSRTSNLGNVGNITITGGTSGQYLKTDGFGNLTWSSVNLGTGNANISGSNTQIFFNNSNSTTLGTSANLTFDTATSTLSVIGNIDASNFNGNGYFLSFINGANVEGTVGTATAAATAGTVTTFDQPNITSIGSLIALNMDINANITMSGEISQISGANLVSANYISGNGRYLTGLSFNDSQFTDVSTMTPNAGQILSYNGTYWTNVNNIAQVSAGPGVDFWLSTPIINAVTANNAIQVDTLSTTPNTSAQTYATVTVNGTGVIAGFVSGALGRTAFDAGNWDFSIWANISATNGTNTLDAGIHQVLPNAGTVTTTGTGTSRTLTASSGTPFATVVPGSDVLLSSYIETPLGLYRVTAKTSDTVVTINTPTGYTNETAVAASVWIPLFNVGSTTFATTSFYEYLFGTTQPQYTVTTNSALGLLLAATTSTSKTIYVTINGTNQASHFLTPLSILHDELAGLQGGSANQYYHLTNSEYTGTGTGTFVRQVSANLTTPNIGAATGTSLNLGGNLISGNANLGHTATANYFIGNGATLTYITGSNVIGNVSSAVQSHYANIANSVSGSNVSGNVSWAVTSNYANTANAVTGANVSGQVSNALIAGTVYTNAQPNITSVGSLTGLTVSNATGVVNLVTTANVSLGNVSNLHITGGASGQILTTDGTGNLEWVDNTPTTVTYIANSVSLTNGVYVTGDLYSVQVFGDYTEPDGVYVLTDGTGAAPAWIFDVDYISVLNFNRVVMNINYTQSSGHTIYVQLYNYDTSFTLSAATVTTTTGTNIVTVSSTTNMAVGQTIKFGTSVGGLTAGAVYYILSIPTSGQLTVGTGTGSGSIVTLSNDSQTSTVQIDIWDNIGTYTGLGSYYAFALQVIDDTSYINSGVVKLRLFHSNAGSALHQTSIDYLALELSNQGPQGPRGPTGATGATGPGVASGGTAGQVLIKNSGTNYDTAWSNDLTSLSNITSNGIVNFINASNVSLGSNANVKLTGGTSGQYLYTDGSGNLSWGTIATASLANGTSSVSIPVVNGNIVLAVAGSTIANVTTNGATFKSNSNITMSGTLSEITGANLISATYLSGNANLLTYIPGANVEGAVATATAATTAGTVTTFAQPNITSVGSLTGLTMDANANITMSGSLSQLSGANLVSATYITGTLTTASQPNITTVGTLSNLTVTSNVTAGNAIIGGGSGGNITGANLVSANYFSGNGSLLTSLTGANITGNAPFAGTANYANTANSVNGANVSGNVAWAVTSNYANTANSITGANVSGNVAWAVTSNYANTANSVAGTDVSGNVNWAITSNYANTANAIAGANVSGQVSNALIAGTVYTNAQPNITSVGTLTSLNVTGNITAGNVSGGNLVSATYISGDGSLLTNLNAANVTGSYSNANVAAYLPTYTGNVSANYFIGNGSTLTNITGANITGNAPFAGTANYANTANAVTGANVSGNVSYAITSNWANTANAVTGTNVSGNVNWAITSNYANTANAVAGADVSGQVSNALIAGTVYTNAQPNITSVGTLTSLSASGNITVSGAGTYFIGNLNTPTYTGTTNVAIVSAGMATSDYFRILVGGTAADSGFVEFATADNGNEPIYFRQYTGISGTPFQTVARTLTLLDDSGNTIMPGNLSVTNGNVTANYFIGNGSTLTQITGANVSGQVGNALISGTVYTNAQPNITSVGTLTSVNVSGDALITGNLTVSGTTEYTNVTNLYVKDPIIELGGGANNTPLTNNDGKDRGTLLHYYTTGVVDAFMGWDNSNGEFGFGNNVSVTNEVVTWNNYGNIRAGYFIGNGSTLTNITGANITGNAPFAGTANYANTANAVTGANVSGQVGNALIAGTVYTNAQPNITSVGTLSNLSVTGNSSAGNIKTDNLLYANGVAWSFGSTYSNTNVAAYLPTYTGNVSANYFIGNGATLTYITGANVTGYVPNAAAANTAGTVTTNAQPNITSVGTLTSLTVTGNVNAGNAIIGSGTGGTISGGNLVSANYVSTDNLLYANGAAWSFTSYSNANVAAYLPTYTGNISAGNIKTDNLLYANGVAWSFGSTYSNTNVAAYLPTYTGNVSANYFIGNGATLTYITGSNVSGNVSWAVTSNWANTANAVAGANVSGNVSWAVTSNYANTANAVTGTNVSGNVNWAITSNWANTANSVSGTNVSGNVNWAITSNYANTANAVAGADVSGQVSNALIAGTVYTNAQPNITSVGTLTGLTVAGGVLYANSPGTSSFNSNGEASFWNGTFVDPDPGESRSIKVGNRGIAILGGTKTDTLNATGNITGSYIFGNGSQLTGITTSYSNANVATYLPTYTGNLVSLTGAVTTTANITANYFIGNGATLTYITGANVNGYVPNATAANTAGTVTTNAQPNITSVGTLTSLAVTGNLTAGNVSGGNLVSANYFSGNGSLLTGIAGTAVSAAGSNTQVQFNDSGAFGASTDFTFNKATGILTVGTSSSGSITGANIISANYFTGTLTTAAQPNVTSLGSLTSLTLAANGNITMSGSASQLSGANLVNATYLTGTLTTAAQPNITSLGTLTSLTTSGNITVSGAGTYFIGNLNTPTYTSTTNVAIVSANMATNDQFRILVGGTGVNNGFVEFATGDDGTEPIYFRQYGSPNFASITRTLTLLDATGNTIMPGNLSVTSNISGGNVSGTYLTGTLTTAAQTSITSVGTLSSLTVSGLITATGTGVKTANIQDSSGTITIRTGYNNISGDVGVYGNIVAGTNGSGNITATYFLGNGSQLSGLPGQVPITDDTGTNATYYPIYATSSTGNLAVAGITTTKLQFNPSSGQLTVQDLNTLSDATLKEDAHVIDDPFIVLNQLFGMGFTWSDSKRKSYGLLAQMLEAILPELVSTNAQGKKTVNYIPIIAFLIEAVKKQQSDIEELKKR